MYKCCLCDSIFNEPEIESINAESEYGISSMFSNSNYIDIMVCPYCGSEEIETYWEDEDEEYE